MSLLSANIDLQCVHEHGEGNERVTPKWSLCYLHVLLCIGLFLSCGVTKAIQVVGFSLSKLLFQSLVNMGKASKHCGIFLDEKLCNNYVMIIKALKWLPVKMIKKVNCFWIKNSIYVNAKCWTYPVWELEILLFFKKQRTY